MKKRSFAAVFAYILSIILEILPMGAVCIFSSDGAGKTKETFSYFSLIPYGYANFAPLITAILSCVLLLFSLILIFKESRGLLKITRIFAVLAAFISLMPFLLGIEYVSSVGVLISLLLGIAVGILCSNRHSSHI